MNEEKPLAESTPGNATPSAAAASSPEPATNSRRARALRLNSAAAFKVPMEPPPAPVQVIDPTLEEDDLLVGIQVSAISRTEKLAGFTLARTLYGGVNSQTLLKDLDKLVEEVYESVAIKLNRKLDPHGGAERTAEWRAECAQAKASEESDLLRGPIPLPPQGKEEFKKFFSSMPPNFGLGPR